MAGATSSWFSSSSAGPVGRGEVAEHEDESSVTEWNPRSLDHHAQALVEGRRILRVTSFVRRAGHDTSRGVLGVGACALLRRSRPTTLDSEVRGDRVHVSEGAML